MSQNNSWNKEKPAAISVMRILPRKNMKYAKRFFLLKGDSKDQEEHEDFPAEELKVSEALLSLETSQEKKKHKLNEANHHAIKGLQQETPYNSRES
ncbi:(Fe-S)-binding prote [Sesbania bispinosa]|nr:(Fe-S)-binding prote [Sesbania bispinosa]